MNTACNPEGGLEKGMKELLASLPQEEIKALLSSATNTLVHFGSVPRDENGKPTTDATTHAINSIFMYSESIRGLLSKQRVKKAYIANYLNEKGVKMTIPATKHSLCQDVLNFWNQRVPENGRSSNEQACRRVPSIQQNSVGHVIENEDIQRSEAQNRIAENETVLVASSTASDPGILNANCTNVIAVAQGQELTNTVNGNQEAGSELGQQLAKEFSTWFYERLNTLTDFTASHFWAECNFRLEIIFAIEPGNTLIDEINMNGEASCAKIKDLVSVKQLYFNPNTTDSGVRGSLNPHGLAQVMVCGTIHHKDGSPVGIFEQMFGLMKDPRMGNNFKIKFSVLRLREGCYLAVQNTPPELCDSTLVGIVEEIDDDEDD